MMNCEYQSHREITYEFKLNPNEQGQNFMCFSLLTAFYLFFNLHDFFGDKGTFGPTKPTQSTEVKT